MGLCIKLKNSINVLGYFNSTLNYVVLSLKF